MQQVLYIIINMQHKEFYTTSEIGKIMGLSRSQIFRKIKKREIPAKKVGRFNLVPRSYVDALLGKLEQDDQRQIQSAINKTIREYGEVIKMLGDK
jgi:excisionase family DNA binding protein